MELTRSQSVSARSPIVTGTGGRSGGSGIVAAAAARRRIAKTTHSLPRLRLVGIGRRLVLVQAKVIDQKARSLQDVLSVDHGNDIRHEIVQVSQGHAVQHGLVRVATDDRNRQVDKGQVEPLDRKSPNVGIVGGILFGPNVQDIVGHGRIKGRHDKNSHHDQQWIGDQTSNGPQKPAKGIIRGPASGARVEGNPLLVLLAKTALHKYQKEQSHRKGTSVAKTGQESIDFQVGLDVVPDPESVHRADNVEIHAEGQNERGSQPTSSNDGELIKHILQIYIGI